MRSDLTDITVVLDRSGSMGIIRSDMEAALNKLVTDQKAGPGEAVFTLYQFDDMIDLVCEAVPVASVEHLTLQPRGSTALFDAMGRAIKEVGVRLSRMSESSRPGKVIFVIITDGLNNASRHYSRDRVFGMIGTQREKYNWQVLFIGANQDAIGVAEGLNIPPGNAIRYAPGGQNVNSVMVAAAGKIASYRAGGMAVMDWTDEERKAALEPPPPVASDPVKP